MERKTQYTDSMPKKNKVLGLDLNKYHNNVLNLTTPSLERPASIIGLYGWSQACEAGCEIQPGDKILSANGVTDAASIVQTLIDTPDTSSLELVMERGIPDAS